MYVLELNWFKWNKVCVWYKSVLIDSANMTSLFKFQHAEMFI